MKINIVHYLYMPIGLQYIGAGNWAVLKKEICVEITPDILSGILGRSLKIDGFQSGLYRYDDKINTAFFSSNMRNLSKKYVMALIAMGYEIVDEGVKHYQRYSSVFKAVASTKKHP